jgi:hypothetical protein
VHSHSTSMVVLAAAYAIGIALESSFAWIVFKFVSLEHAWRYSFLFLGLFNGLGNFNFLIVLTLSLFYVF